MSASPSQNLVAGSRSVDSTSRSVVTGSASNELIFGVVGHVGSGTSEIAGALKEILGESELAGRRFEVDIIAANTRPNLTASRPLTRLESLEKVKRARRTLNKRQSA